MSRIPKKFPVAVKAGSTSVKIYRDVKPSGSYFRVVFYLGGKRHRLNFHDYEEAHTEAEAKAAQLSRGDVDAVQLNGKDRLIYGRALEAIRSLDVPLDAAAIDYAEARKILGGHSLTEASRFFMRHHGQGIAKKPVSEAVDEIIEQKRLEGRSELYLNDLTYRLGDFKDAFNVDVRQLIPDDVRAFLEGLKFGPRSFNNHRRTLQTFFRFCQGRGWLSREIDILEGVSPRKEPAADVEIFTAAELRKILAEASDEAAVCIAIQAFAGVRSEELLRLSWKDVRRRAGFIEISAGKAKTAQRRLIPIQDNLADWLAVAPGNGEMVWPDTKPMFFKSLRVAAKDAKVKWKANGLRHSFASYRLAEAKDMAAVALECGNSPAMIVKHYRELATDAEASEWFGIKPAPEMMKNVVRMAS